LPVGLEQKWRRHGDAFAVDPDGVLGRSSRNRGLRAVAPAMPTASAPLRIAVSANAARSSPGSKTIGSMPRLAHCAIKSKRAAFPPPERGLMMSWA
jgi:hypothetical protein